MSSPSRKYVKATDKEYQYSLIAREILKSEIRFNNNDMEMGEECDDSSLDFYADTILSEKHNQDKYHFIAKEVIRKVKWMLSVNDLEETD